MIHEDDIQPANKLNHILKNERAAVFYVNSPRGGNVYKVRQFKNFVETFGKAEGCKMEAERISPNGTHVKIWLRGYGVNSYMLETEADNVLISIPAA